MWSECVTSARDEPTAEHIPIVESTFKDALSFHEADNAKMDDAFAQLVAGLQQICDHVRRPDAGQRRVIHFNGRHCEESRRREPPCRGPLCPPPQNT